MMTCSRVVSVLLLLSAINLALMIPGGLVETRDFPNYSVAVLIAFNVFLTGLGLGSLILAFRVFQTRQVGPLMPLAGLAYTAVYLLDLVHIFPVSSTPMPGPLMTLEVVGTALGLALTDAGLRCKANGSAADRSVVGLPRWALVILPVLAGTIIIFATISAQ